MTEATLPADTDDADDMPGTDAGDDEGAEADDLTTTRAVLRHMSKHDREAQVRILAWVTSKLRLGHVIDGRGLVGGVCSL